jgi:hypothetical protein
MRFSRPGDPANYVLILFMLILVSALAAVLPARRASKAPRLRILKDQSINLAGGPPSLSLFDMPT